MGKHTMNIGIFTDTYTPEINGVVTSIEAFRKGLEERGHMVFVFAPSSTLSSKHEVGTRLWRFPSIRFYGDKQVRIVLPTTITKKIKPLALDIIHTQTPSTAGILGIRAGRKLAIPLVHTYHTFFEQYLHYVHLPLWLLRKPLIGATRWFLEKHDAIITPSEGMKKILDTYRIEKKITVLPTGVNPIAIRKRAKRYDPDQLLKSYHIDRNALLLVTTSRLGKEKNIEFLIDAFQYIVTKHPRARMLIIGDGPHREVLENKTRDNNLQNKILFTGFWEQDKVFALYKRVSVFMFASKTETQGLVLVEAMAMGVPTVAVQSMGVEDVLGDNRGGFLMPENIKLFSKAVLKLLASKKLWERVSRDAKQKASTLSIQTTTRHLLSLYKNTILSRKRDETS